MISDEERIAAAKALRERAKRPLDKSMQLMFSETLGLYRTNIGWAKPTKATETWANIVNYLADLIDRPTCTIKHDAPGTNPTTWGVCLRCGALVNAERAVSNAAEYLPMKYCPNCGARVVRDGD